MLSPRLIFPSRTRNCAPAGGAANHRGFTLIELLIVVAIIAVLAAIAVPNFLEAQTRSKVSRTHADLRSIALALEAYRVDANSYPPVGDPASPTPVDALTPFYDRIRPVTTPIAYITSIPVDPFARIGEMNGNGLMFTDPIYCYSPGNVYFTYSSLPQGPEVRAGLFSVSGRGPDRIIFYGNYCMGHPMAFQGGANVKGAYDPTNGTVSAGDVWRLGGGSQGRNL